jgi:hypothetical protein
MAISYKPRRNPLCQFYSHCLAPAAKRNLMLDCGQCPRKEERCLDTDFTGEVLLLLRIFRPTMYRRFIHRRNRYDQGILNRVHDLKTKQIPFYMPF